MALIEEEIEALESEISISEIKMAEPENFSNPEKLAEINSIYETLKNKLEQKNNEWETLVLEIEDHE